MSGPGARASARPLLRRAVGAALASLVAALTGCGASSSSPARPGPWSAGDAHFERGEYAEAAAAYDCGLRHRPDAPERAEAEYRAALSYLAQPETRQRARQLLEAVAGDRGAVGREASILLSYMGELDGARRQARRDEQRLAAVRAALLRLQQETIELLERARRRDQELLEAEEERERLARELELRKATIAEQEERIELMRGEIEALEEQLDALKDIDLERPN